MSGLITRSTHVPTNDERRGAWAHNYYATGHHHLSEAERYASEQHAPDDEDDMTDYG